MIKEDPLARMTASIEAAESANSPGASVMPGVGSPVLATPVAAVAFGAGMLFTLAKGMQSPLTRPTTDVLAEEATDD